MDRNQQHCPGSCRVATMIQHEHQVGYSTENTRSRRDSLPCLSLTETVNLAFVKAVMGLSRTSSHTPCAFSWNFEARLLPAAILSTGKSATTRKLCMSSPVYASAIPTRTLRKSRFA